MSSEDARPEPIVIPRPGVVRTLGILNIVFSSLIGVGLVMSVFWLGAGLVAGSEWGTSTTVAAPSSRPGLDARAYLFFVLGDAISAAALNALMFATGIGLYNLRGWAARWWTWTAWVKIVRLFLAWGYFLIAVSPALAVGMARSIFEEAFRSNGPGRGPTLAHMAQVFAWTFMVLAVGMIGLGSIYPAISIWMMGRPGVRAAVGADAPGGGVEA